MPIYEYTCRQCGHQFERLVRGNRTPACPECEAADPERLFSLPQVHGQGMRDRSLRAAGKRDRARGTERMHERLRYERSHDRHG